ncbi:MAG: hypothetical protein HYV77_02925 [Candidatus Wildermuthbacteria bacterium]|nr:hypothetical protein [Candidatus Wildermuthbacteria bacterium]
MEHKASFFRLLTPSIALFFVIPLLNIPPLFSPPAWGQTIAFRILLGFLVIFFAYYITKKNLSFFTQVIQRISANKWPLILLGFFFVLSLLATLFSQEPSFSFWGDPYRSGGVFQMMLFAVFGLIAFVSLQADNWRKVWLTAIGAGFVIALIAIAQQFHLFSNILVAIETRPPSTVGGALFLGTFLVLLSFPTLFYLIHTPSKRQKLFFSAVLALFILVIFLSGSRSAYIAIAHPCGLPKSC